MKPINFEEMAVQHYAKDESRTFEQLETDALIIAPYNNRRELRWEAEQLAYTIFCAYLMNRDEAHVFDATYPPDTSFPPSDEFDPDDQPGYYGSSAHDFRIVASADPLCVWTFEDLSRGLTACSGLHLINRVNYFISSVPRMGQHEETYLLLPEVKE